MIISVLRMSLRGTDVWVVIKKPTGQFAKSSKNDKCEKV